MYTIKKILVPTDFSENSSVAYHPAQQLASSYGAKIDLIHIIPTLSYFNESMADLGVPLSLEQDLYPEIRKQSSSKLNRAMDENIRDENKGKCLIQIAPKPSRAISDHAEKGGYDLIVMAANGLHKSELLRGSVTEKVIRYSDVPVLSTDQSDLDDIKKILVPTDGSRISMKALPLAISLALTFEAGITLLHILELHGSRTENALKDPAKTVTENIRDTIYEALEDFFVHSWDEVEVRRGEGLEGQLVYNEGASNATINFNAVIEKGVSAHHAITNYAKEDSDMIIMATHGRSGLAHLFLGSTAEKVVQHSVRPVITLKPEFDEAN